MSQQRLKPERLFQVLAAAIGQDVYGAATPWVVFHDLDHLSNRLQAVSQAFPSGSLHTVAIKANPLIEILKIIVDAGFGLEAASWEEVEIARAAGCPPERLIFDSPAKTVREIDSALQANIVLNANSLAELSRIADCYQTTSTSAVGLRINPEVGAGTIARTSVAGHNSKFGISLSRELDNIVEAYERYPWLTGMHVHVGSQGCSLDQLVAGTHAAVETIRCINDRCGPERIQWLDIGGGLPVSYGEQTGIEFSSYAEALSTYVRELKENNVRLFTEFGRAIQANCGWAASRIEYVDDQATQPHLIAHFGADFLMRPVYAPDEWRHEYLLATDLGHQKHADSRSFDIAGPLCFGGDFPARDIALNDPRPSDILIVRDVGAYTLSLWSRHCNRAIPPVLGYVIDNEQIQFRELRAGENPEDIVRLWS